MSSAGTEAAGATKTRKVKKTVTKKKGGDETVTTETTTTVTEESSSSSSKEISGGKGGKGKNKKITNGGVDNERSERKFQTQMLLHGTKALLNVKKP